MERDPEIVVAVATPDNVAQLVRTAADLPQAAEGADGPLRSLVDRLDPRTDG